MTSRLMRPTPWLKGRCLTRPQSYRRLCALRPEARRSREPAAGSSHATSRSQVWACSSDECDLAADQWTTDEADLLRVKMGLALRSEQQYVGIE